MASFNLDSPTWQQQQRPIIPDWMGMTQNPNVANPADLATYGSTPVPAGFLDGTMKVNTNPSATGIQKWLAEKGIIGSTDANGIKTDGWGGLALGAATGLGSLYLGMQQYNLAKDTLANNKAQFERNYAANRTTTNAALEDRQRARVASNAGAYQSVGDYMNQNRVV